MNPELKRNLIVEFSTQRLIAMPVIIGLVVLATWTGQGLEGVVFVTNLGFWAILLLWGTRRVAGAFDAELVNNTWDGQRLSALSAFELFLGKFLGAPAFVYYGAGMLLAVEVLASLYALHIVSPPILIGEGAVTTAAVLGSALRDILSVLLALAVSMLVAVALLKRRRAGKGISITLCQLAGIAVALVIVQSLDIFSSGPLLYAEILDFEDLGGRVVEWYGFALVLNDFLVASLAVFLAWTVLGIVRELRSVLRFRSFRWAWAAFVVFTSLYFAGFDAFYIQTDTFGQQAFVFFVLFWSTALPLTYVVLLIEAKPIGDFRALAGAVRSGNAGTVCEYLPLWLLSLVIVWLAMAGFLIFSAPIDFGSDAVRGFLEADIVRAAPSIFLVSVSLFVLRDCLLVLVLNLGRRPVRSDLAAVIYLGVLYFLVPLLLGTVALEQSQVMAFFIPRPDLGWLAATVPPLVEAGGLAVLALVRWRKIRQPLRNAG